MAAFYLLPENLEQSGDVDALATTNAIKLEAGRISFDPLPRRAAVIYNRHVAIRRHAATVTVA